MNGNRRLRRKIASTLAILAAAASGASTSHSDVRMTRVRRDMLCVTEGTVEEVADQRLSANVPKMRAVLNRRTHDFGGHKEDAIHSSEEAIRQLRLALQYRGHEDREHERDHDH